MYLCIYVFMYLFIYLFFVEIFLLVWVRKGISTLLQLSEVTTNKKNKPTKV